MKLEQTSFKTIFFKL